MRLIPVVLAIVAAASAHFQLQYPIPRGPFVMNSEPTFCDGYNNAVPNRTVFPLNSGVIDLNSEHPIWTIGAIISTNQDPTTFSDFNSSSGYQLVVPFFQVSGEGKFCFPINIGAAGIAGVQDGVNATIQFIYDGGDGTLYQCADVTLSAKATIPSNATSNCTDVIPIGTSASTSVASQTASSTASSTASPTTKNSAERNIVGGFGVFAAALTAFSLLL